MVRRTNEIRGGEPQYKLIIEDVDFEPEEAYLISMREMVDQLSSEEIEVHHQNDLDFVFEPEKSTVIDISNRPNPFNGQTTIEFNLPEDAEVTLFISDMNGKQIARLLDGKPTHKGTHQVVFDGHDYPAGIYYYTIQAGQHITTQKMIILQKR